MSIFASHQLTNYNKHTKSPSSTPIFSHQPCTNKPLDILLNINFCQNLSNLLSPLTIIWLELSLHPQCQLDSASLHLADGCRHIRGKHDSSKSEQAPLQFIT